MWILKFSARIVGFAARPSTRPPNKTSRSSGIVPIFSSIDYRLGYLSESSHARPHGHVTRRTRHRPVVRGRSPARPGPANAAPPVLERVVPTERAAEVVKKLMKQNGVNYRRVTVAEGGAFQFDLDPVVSAKDDLASEPRCGRVAADRRRGRGPRTPPARIGAATDCRRRVGRRTRLPSGQGRCGIRQRPRPELRRPASGRNRFPCPASACPCGASSAPASSSLRRARAGRGCVRRGSNCFCHAPLKYTALASTIR